MSPGATGGSPTTTTSDDKPSNTATSDNKPSNTTTSDNKPSNTSIIVGTVLGTFAGTLLLVGGFLLYRRNRKDQESDQQNVIQIAGSDDQGEREGHVYGSGGAPLLNTSVNYPPASTTSPAPINNSGQGPLQTPRNEYNYAPIAPTPVNSYGQERNYNLGQERNYNYEQERSYNLPTTINNERVSTVSTVSTADMNSIKNELKQEIMQNLRQEMLQNNGKK